MAILKALVISKIFWILPIRTQMKSLSPQAFQNDYSEYFETRKGQRQWNVLSTLIFNVVLESIVRWAKIQINTVIIGRSHATVRNAFLTLEREANKIGLKINGSATKYMIWAGNGRTVCGVSQHPVFVLEHKRL
jgi:hypothetical protein